jgi:hypothetical protein
MGIGNDGRGGGYMPGKAVIWGAGVMLAVAAWTSACGDDDSSSSESVATTTTVSSEEQLCQDRDALRDSVEALTNVDVAAEGTSGLEAAVTDVKDSVEALRASASENFQPQVEELRGALEELETALGDVRSGGVSAVATAALAVATAGSTLLASLESVDCG